MSTGSVVRKRLAVAVTLALLAAVIATFLTGFVAAALDLNRFGYHKYAAYLAIALAVAHVVFHWRSLTGQFRRWLLRAGRIRDRAKRIDHLRALLVVLERVQRPPGLVGRQRSRAARGRRSRLGAGSGERRDGEEERSRSRTRSGGVSRRFGRVVTHP